MLIPTSYFIPPPQLFPFGNQKFDFGILEMFLFFFFLLFRATPTAYGGPRLGVKSELLAYSTATETLDPSHICELHKSLQQCQILNPLSEARN